MNKRYQAYLRKIYYNTRSPESFTSKNKIWRFIQSRKDKPKGLTSGILQEWLQREDTPSVFKKNSSKFKKEKIIVSCSDEQWSADLMDMSKLKAENGNITFILVIIDVFSKFAWLEPLLNKKAETVKIAFSKVLDQGRKPQRLWVDGGSEFQNKVLKKYCLEKDIHMFIARSESKSVFAERLIKTIKLKLFKYMYYKQTYKYIDVLQDIVKSYNESYHRSIKMAPSDVNETNELAIYLRDYMPFVDKTNEQVEKSPLEKGTLVRVSHKKEPFVKGYSESFSEEIFIISQIINSQPKRYSLVDALGEKVKGTFYSKELQFVYPDENREYKLNRILKYRDNKKQALVEWYGYSSKFNSWIPSNQIKKYNKK